MNFINTLLSTIDTQVSHYTFDAYHSIASYFSTTLTLLLLVYFAGLGWLVIRGLVPLTPIAIAWHMFKVGFIYAFAIHWDYFAYFVVNFFLHGTDQLIAKLISGINTSNNIASITNAIAQIWQNGSNVFVQVWRESGPNFFLGSMIGLIGYGIVIGITASALFYIVMAKIALSILLVLAPVILPFYLWNTTRAIFNGWLRLLVKWMLVPVFIYIFIALYMNIIQGQIEAMNNSSSGINTATISAFVVIGLIVIATFRQAANMAAEIARNLAIKDAGASASHWLDVPSTAWKSWTTR